MRSAGVQSTTAMLECCVWSFRVVCFMESQVAANWMTGWRRNADKSTENQHAWQLIRCRKDATFAVFREHRYVRSLAKSVHSMTQKSIRSLRWVVRNLRRLRILQDLSYPGFIRKAGKNPDKCSQRLPQFFVLEFISLAICGLWFAGLAFLMAAAAGSLKSHCIELNGPVFTWSKLINPILNASHPCKAMQAAE